MRIGGMPETAGTGAMADRSSLADAIDAVLPQTQCTRCGYPGCRPYAEAVAHADAAINRCPPGGEAGIRALAALTGRPAVRLDPACGDEAPRRLALIDEALCIGCTICIQKCPVDAIVGAPKLMHTVIAALCTGCDLCIAPCPVDCIVMVAAPDAPWTDDHRADARRRFERRNARIAREAARRLIEGRGAQAAVVSRARDAGPSKLAVIRAAVERARAKRAAVAKHSSTPEE